MNKTLTILFFTLLLDLVGVGMVIPLIPIIFTDSSSASFLLGGFDQKYWYLIAGLATGLYGLMQFIAAPILGELSDMYGRKKLLSLGVGVLAVSQFIFALGVLTKSIFLIFLSRILGGMAGANLSIAQATISDISTPADRAKNFGLIGAAFGIGFILGPVLGGYLAAVSGSAAVPFLVAGILGFINFASVTLFLKETNKNLKEKTKVTLTKGIANIKQAFTDVDASPAYVTSFLQTLGFAFFTSFAGIYLVGKYNLSEGGLGTYFGVVGVFIVITQVFILRFLTKRYSERQILRVTLLIVGVGIAFVPFMNSILAQYLLVPFIAIPQGLTMANMSAYISKKVSPLKQGAALGINGSLGAFSQGVVPTIAGLVTTYLGLQAPFILGGLFIISSWYIFIKNTN